ncbi:MAG: M28 family peptidase, partial [Anaerolineae bacterium]|nr:M28 family peptidase [Anaerolineae bacterium]
MTAMDHVRYLAETIGPRGSTTPEEARAAQYAADALRGLGLKPTVELFTSAKSAWYPYVLFSGVMLAGTVLFWVAGTAGATAALVLALIALGSVLLELAFRPNPFRAVLPKGRSQNVWARIPPTGDVKTRVVLLGHLDTHRTPLVFSTDAWLRLFKTLVPLGLASSVALAVLFAIGIGSQAVIWRTIALPPAWVLAAILALTVQADRTPFTAGANDNATAVGIVLHVAERLTAEPLAHTEVWAVLSGCEEVGCYGADAFARAHKAELGGAVWIALDGVGSRGRPVYITRETFLLSAPSDPDLVALAGRIAATHPELGAEADAFAGAYTEGAIGVMHGFRVLTLTSAPRGGVLTEWHRPT